MREAKAGKIRKQMHPHIIAEMTNNVVVKVLIPTKDNSMVY